MSAKKKTSGEQREHRSHDEVHPLQWLLERGGQALGQAVREFAAQPGVTEGVANLAREAVRTKGRVDKNVEQVLHALNLPSRADYDKLLRKMELLQGSLVNLNIKLDRALAAQKAAQAADEKET